MKVKVVEKNKKAVDETRILYPDLEGNAKAECLFCAAEFVDSLLSNKKDNKRCPDCKEYALVRHITTAEDEDNV